MDPSGFLLVGENFALGVVATFKEIPAI